MSLRIVYGVAGSGKTKQCFDFIDKIITETEHKVIYVVPEQYSLEAERDISVFFSKKALDRVEVLNPDRLAKRVFSTVGPVMCDFVDDNAKLMILEKAIIKVSGKLTYFTKNVDVPGFSSVILNLIKDLKNNCINVETLEKIIEESSDTVFKYKLYDLLLIYSEYEKFFDFPYCDSDDNMNRLAEKIDTLGLFKDTYFVFDNFVSFSKQQYRVIESIIKNSPYVIFSLTTDNFEDREEFQLFYKSNITAGKILDIAGQNSIEILPTVYVEKKEDIENELVFLKNNYFSYKKNIYDKKTKNLFVCKSDSYRKETEQIANEIYRLVREEDYKYGDFAVVTRSPDVYNPIIRDVFERYGIFYNIAETKHSNNNFIFSALMSVFNVVINKYSFDSVFDFVRSCLCNMKDENKFLLENYILEVGNRDKIWTEKDEISFKGSFSDYEISKINESLNYVRKCFSSFTDNFKGRKTVREIVSAYSDFLKFTDAENIITDIVKNLRKTGNNEAAEETISVYNHIISSINQMLEYFGDISITFEKFYKILESALSNTEIDALPSGIDDVVITTVDRFQATKRKVVFVIGVSEGVIPRGYIKEGIFKDSELKILGIEENVLQMHSDENYVIYRLFSSATDKLYISYPTADNEGEAISPSYIISNIQNIFTNITVLQNIYEKINKLEDVEGVIPTFNKVIENNSIGFWSTVSEWYKNNKPELYNIMENAKRYTNLPPVLQNDVVKKLYGTEIKSSISRVERYNQCQFAYFIRYGLNVDERKEYKLEAKDYGTYMHEIIEKFSLFAEDFGWVNVTREICEEKSKEFTIAVLNEYLSGFYTESKRQTYLFNKIISTMNTVLWNITCFYKESGYVSIGHELVFDEDSEYKPIEMNLSDGTVVRLRGKIDRADIKRTANGDFVSIVDYKSSAKDISFEKILCGIQIQLPVYISAVCKNLSDKGENVIPAAMLYYHIDNPIIDGDVNMDNDKILEKIENSLKMKGIIHESADIPSVYIAKKNFTINQIDKLCKTAYRKMKDALEDMIMGNININPVCADKLTACDYCPYGNICNFDTELKGNNYRKYKNMDKEEFFDYVDKVDS